MRTLTIYGNQDRGSLENIGTTIRLEIYFHYFYEPKLKLIAKVDNRDFVGY